ncbi:hypothetical protein JCM10908_002145 [Rhodotorula pacifica]|uniref:uncharacterized protein n=1 Tax=Rhodotorula pacifica TaxID=1495444 RepID=UPI0031810655
MAAQSGSKLVTPLVGLDEVPPQVRVPAHGMTRASLAPVMSRNRLSRSSQTPLRNAKQFRMERRSNVSA